MRAWYAMPIHISTHTLTWSVTRDACMVCNANPHFNSHAHVERDSVCEQEIKGYFNFNSHAHVERDDAVLGQLSNSDDFNSHAHVERDPGKIVMLSHPFFISTHTLTWSVTIPF